MPTARAFTLVEVVVAVAVIAIISAVVLLVPRSGIDGAEDTLAQSTLHAAVDAHLAAGAPSDDVTDRLAEVNPHLEVSVAESTQPEEVSVASGGASTGFAVRSDSGACWMAVVGPLPRAAFGVADEAAPVHCSGAEARFAEISGADVASASPVGPRSDVNAHIVEDGPTHWWPLDDPPGDEAQDVVGEEPLNVNGDVQLSSAGPPFGGRAAYLSRGALETETAIAADTPWAVELWWRGEGDGTLLSFGDLAVTVDEGEMQLQSAGQSAGLGGARPGWQHLAVEVDAGGVTVWRDTETRDGCDDDPGAEVGAQCDWGVALGDSTLTIGEAADISAATVAVYTGESPGELGWSRRVTAAQ